MVDNSTNSALEFLDRRRTISWTSPTGKIFNLTNIREHSYSFKHYGNLYTIATAKESQSDTTVDMTKGDVFTDLGVSGREITLTILFSGNNHDLESQKFELAFRELGSSKLQLAYGNPLRVNAQSLTKTQHLVENVASTSLEVSFIEVQQNLPLGTAPNTAKLQEQIAEVETQSQNSLMAQLQALDVDDLTKAYDSLGKEIVNLSNVFSDVTTGDFQAILRDIQANLLNTSSNTLLQQTSKLLDLGFKVAGSAPTLGQILSKSITPLQQSNVSSKAELLMNHGLATSCLLSTAKVISNNTLDLQTRREASQLATTLQTIYDDYVNHYELTAKALVQDFQDVLVDRVSLHTLMAQVINSLLESSLTLKTELFLTLEQDVTLINLAYEYYREEFTKNPEATLDKIITINRLQDEELILIPKHRQITLYV